MSIYFFTKPYKERQKVVKMLEEIGFQESNDIRSCILPDESLWINFTDLKEARFQIQGQKDDVLKDGKYQLQPDYDPSLEKLSKTLKPHTIVNDGYQNVYPQLVVKE